MQDRPDKSEDKNVFDPMEAWSSVKIKTTRSSASDLENRNFTVGLWAGIWCAICMVLAGLMSLGINHGNALVTDAAGAAGYRLGGVIGSALAVLVMAYIAGWLFWRIAGRKAGVGRLVFSLMAGLALLSQFGQLASYQQERKSIDEVMKAFQEMPQQAEKFQAEYPRNKQEVPAFIDKVLRQYDATAAQGDSTDALRSRRFAQVRQVLEHRLIVEIDYFMVLNRLQEHYNQQATYFRNQDNVDKAVAAAGEIFPAGQTYLRDVKAYPAYARSVMSEEAFPSREMGAFFNGMEMATKAIDYELDQFVAANNRFASAGSDMLQMLVKNKKKWQVGADQKYEFYDQVAMDEFREVQSEFLRAESVRLAAFRRIETAKSRLLNQSPDHWSD
jgi:hypothetical protein